MREVRPIEHATASTCMLREPVSLYWGCPFELGYGYGRRGGVGSSDVRASGSYIVQHMSHTQRVHEAQSSAVKRS